LGFVFQQHHLLPQCTLFENVLLPVLPLKKKVSDDDMLWAEHLLKKTGIWEVRNQKPGEMSGGECQRAAVVRALVNKPSMILADEPTGALDEKNADILGDLLVTICREEGITLVTVTHSATLAAKMNTLIHLRNGILIF
jgi:ABC-type lipoprotein export system ATPase subunit